MQDKPVNQFSHTGLPSAPRTQSKALSIWRCFNWLCVVVVLILLGVRTWAHRGPNKASTLPVETRMSDYSVNTAISTKLCQDPDHRYWCDFAYPPSAVLLWHAFGTLGYPPGAAAWLVLLAAALSGSLLIAMRITDTRPVRQALLEPPSGLLLALAFAATEYYCIWDLSAANSNSIYLVMVLGGMWSWLCNRPSLAGVLLGASVAVKIYSVFFLPFLLLRRQWRAVTAMVLSLAFCFVAVPCAYFGIAGALQITMNWLRTVVGANGIDYMLQYSGFKVSFSWVAILLLDPRASAGKLNVMECSPQMVLWLIRGVYVVWLVLVATYFATSRPVLLQSQRGRLALALDASVLLMLPLPLSPFLQPPHPVVLLLPAIALLRYSLLAGGPLATRVGAALAVASGMLVELTDNPWRGIGVMLTIAAYFAGIWTVRRALAASEPLLTAQANQQPALCCQ